MQAVDSTKEREELFEDWVDEKEKEVRWFLTSNKYFTGSITMRSCLLGGREGEGGVCNPCSLDNNSLHAHCCCFAGWVDEKGKEARGLCLLLHASHLTQCITTTLGCTPLPRISTFRLNFSAACSCNVFFAGEGAAQGGAEGEAGRLPRAAGALQVRTKLLVWQRFRLVFKG